MAFNVDHCQQHKSCGACVSEDRVQCGWCVADGRCSSRAQCKPASSTPAHWLHGSKLQCLRHSGTTHSAHEQRLSVDDLHPVCFDSNLLKLDTSHAYLGRRD